jgi:endonuclease V-like protein UPF0215 family
MSVRACLERQPARETAPLARRPDSPDDRRVTARRFSNLLGVDDAPFAREHRGDVAIVGTVCTRGRLDGVLTSKIRRDGVDSARRIAAMLSGSAFDAHVQAVVLQGIALGGFNVVDLEALSAAIARPVLVVARREPDMTAIRSALLKRVRGGARKWALVERAGAMEPLAGVWVQRHGLTPREATQLIADSRVHGTLPEPLRLAHLIAGALGRGYSRGRA